MKESKFKKYIIPLALVKIALAFLVLQLFFTSCESEDILYNSGLYTEGPLCEIEASFGNENVNFETGRVANRAAVGDTLYLEIAMETSTLLDKLSLNDITLINPLFFSQFSFLDTKGEAIFPNSFEIAGTIDSITSGGYDVSFGNVDVNNGLKNPLQNSTARLKLGFVFENAGGYTLHFINTPNNLTSDGNVDIHYDRDPDDLEAMKTAYAVYLFTTDSSSQRYDSGPDLHKSEVLALAGSDQAIIDFAIYENK